MAVGQVTPGGAAVQSNARVKSPDLEHTIALLSALSPADIRLAALAELRDAAAHAEEREAAAREAEAQSTAKLQELADKTAVLDQRERDHAAKVSFDEDRIGRANASLENRTEAVDRRERDVAGREMEINRRSALLRAPLAELAAVVGDVQ